MTRLPMNESMKMPGRQPTVLIVDDARLNLEILNQILSGEYRVVRACDGRQALDLVAIQPPDIILLDIVMPGLDGYQVCTLLKSDARTRDIPVIFVTGMDDGGSHEQGMAVGAAGFLTKPFRPAAVLSQVHIQLDLRRTKDLLASPNGENAEST